MTNPVPPNETHVVMEGVNRKIDDTPVVDTGKGTPLMVDIHKEPAALNGDETTDL